MLRIISYLTYICWEIDNFEDFHVFEKIVFKKVLKRFRRVLKSKNSLKSLIFKKVQKVKKI